MGVTAANVPSFRGQTSLSLGDLQDLTEVVKALMLQADAPPGRVRTGAAKAVPVHNPPPSGVYFNGKVYEPQLYFRPRPGLVQDLAFQEGVTEPCFVHGHGLLPLAEADAMSTGGSPVGRSIPGGIAGIRYVSGLTAPRIAAGGIIELPPGGGESSPVPLAQWTQEGGSQVAGRVKFLSLEAGYEKPAARDGHIFFPLAATVDASGVARPTAVAGAIAGIRYADPSSGDPSAVGSGVEPRIVPGGIIELPPPADGALKGIRDASGVYVGWSDVEGAVGSQVRVASVFVPVADGLVTPLSLYAGYEGGYLTFSLSDSI